MEKYLPLLLLSLGCTQKDPEKLLIDSFESEVRARVDTIYTTTDKDEFKRMADCVTPPAAGQFIKPGGDFDERKAFQQKWWTDEQSKIIAAGFIDLESYLGIQANRMESLVCDANLDQARLDLVELTPEEAAVQTRDFTLQSDYAATNVEDDGSIRVNMVVYSENAIHAVQPTTVLFHEWIHVLQSEEATDLCENYELKEGMADTLSYEFFGNEDVVVAYPVEDLKLAFLGKEYLREAVLDMNLACHSRSWESPLFTEGMFRFFDEHQVVPSPGNIALFKSIYDLEADEDKSPEEILIRVSDVIVELGLDWDEIQKQYLIKKV